MSDDTIDRERLESAIDIISKIVTTKPWAQQDVVAAARAFLKQMPEKKRATVGEMADELETIVVATQHQKHTEIGTVVWKTDELRDRLRSAAAVLRAVEEFKVDCTQETDEGKLVFIDAPAQKLLRRLP